MTSLEQQRGVTMIEILVTMFVLAIGLSGILSMEAYSMRVNHESYLRTQAMLQVQEMADRMHANLDGVAANQYTSGIPSTAPTQTCLKDSACTPAQLAERDKWEWEQSNKAALPDGAGTVTVSGTGANITISWSELSDAGKVTRAFTFFYKPLPLNLI